MRFERSREFGHGRTAEALSVDHEPRGRRGNDEALRNFPALILERLGEDALFGFPEAERELAYTFIGIVPMVPPA